jgi:hypothetical protein
MKTKLRTVIMSHLSDAQEEINMGYAKNGTIHNINFVKYLLLTHVDLNTEIDADYEYSQFNKQTKNK